jgi:hypothetical protein
MAETAGICRATLADLGRLEAGAEVEASLRARLEALTGRLEALQTKFFLRMSPSLRYATACLEAARASRGSVAGGAADDLAVRLDMLDRAVTTLEDRANSAGSMTIT